MKLFRIANMLPIKGSAGFILCFALVILLILSGCAPSDETEDISGSSERIPQESQSEATDKAVYDYDVQELYARRSGD